MKYIVTRLRRLLPAGILFLAGSVEIRAQLTCPATLDPVADKVFCAGATSSPIAFSGAATSYTWTNNRPGIGLAATGTGTIAPFTVLNPTSIGLTADVTVTPKGVTTGGLEYAYIPNRDDNTVSVIDNSTLAVVGTIPVGAEPLGIAISPDAMRVYVSNAGSDNVSVIATASHSVVGTIAVGNAPFGLALSPDGSRLYVSNMDDHTVHVINTATLAPLDTIAVGLNPVGLAVSANGQKLYVCNDGSNSVSVINTASNTVQTTIGNIGGNPDAILLSPDGNRLYVSNLSFDEVTVIDVITNTIITRIGTGLMPFGMAVSPDGLRLYVANFNSADVTVINTVSLDIDTIIVMPALSSPCGVSISADGSRVYVTQQDNDNVAVISTATNAIVQNLAVGAAPVGLGSFLAVPPAQACSGQSRTFTIVANPLPRVAAPGNRAVCPDDAVSLSFVSNIANSSFAWTNTNTATGLAGTGAGDIGFIAMNNTAATQVSAISVAATANGCTGPAQQFNISVNWRPAQPVITQVGNTLRSSAPAGNHWFVDNTELPGITAQTITPPLEGIYTVQVSGATPCRSLWSAPVAFVVTAVNDPVLERGITVGPVPAGSLLQVRTHGGLGTLSARVFGADGSLLIGAHRFTSTANLNVGQLPAGVYYLEIRSERAGTRLVRAFQKL
ncbi:MAG: hypothetical protein EOO15_09120 [Chitinophagaceae bacterium]|nr:MAG: hypothetical protein EOO15_09120 [Chitinophagaceae bacterium]